MPSALLALLSAPAVAADAPEFLIGNIGVRVDLPSGWKMTRWSDDDFAGSTNDGAMLVFAWSTPIQVPITEPAPWGPAFTAKVEEMSGKKPEIEATTAEEIGGRRVALVNVGFSFGDGSRGTMYGAVVEIPGRDLLVATIAPQRMRKAGEKARHDLVARLEHGAPPPASTFGATVKATGAETKLPDDFRPLLDAEWNAVTPALAKLGREDYTPCWTAIRPRPVAEPDLLVACPGLVQLGVVDEHSFETAEAEVRERLFGKSLAAGVPAPLSDRMGFLYTPRDGLAMGAVPNASGVAVFWGLGEGPMGDAVSRAMAASTFDGPHPVSAGDQVSYWLGERTFSPQVLCPALGCAALGLGLVGGVGAVVMRPKRRSDDDA